MSEELKPCPFCGPRVAAPRMYKQKGGVWNWCWVQCDDCDCEGPTAKTKKGAASLWNSRPSSEEREAGDEGVLLR